MIEFSAVFFVLSVLAIEMYIQYSKLNKEQIQKDFASDVLNRISYEGLSKGVLKVLNNNYFLEEILKNNEAKNIMYENDKYKMIRLNYKWDKKKTKIYIRIMSIDQNNFCEERVFVFHQVVKLYKHKKTYNHYRVVTSYSKNERISNEKANKIITVYDEKDFAFKEIYM
ncbi:MAG: hypothetical protein RR988_01895 [Clostridia bacterium]